MKKVLTLTLPIAASLAIFSGCAITNTAGGAATGAVAGAIAGSMVGNHKDAMIGAAGGAVAGAMIGKEADDQAREKRLHRVYY